MPFVNPKRTASLPKPKMKIGRTNPFLLQIQRGWEAIEIKYTGNPASTWRLSFLTMMIAPLRTANRAPNNLGTLSVRLERESYRAAVTGSQR